MSQLIVSYYTQGPYAKEIQRLLRSLERLQLGYKAYGVAPFADWSHAARYKPRFLRMVRREYTDYDLLFLDADAVVWQDPWPRLLSEYRVITEKNRNTADIGLHVLDGYVQSGTIFLPADGLRTDELLKCWRDEDDESTVTNRPQRVLQRTLNKYSFSVMPLDADLCWIFDISGMHYPLSADTPYIEHLQASRDYRNPELFPIDAANRRHERIREVEEALAC